MRARWRLIAGIAISVLFLFIAVRGLKLEAFVAALHGADYVWLVPGIAVYFLAVAARTWRWHYMMRHIRDIPLAPLFRIVCIGYMGNNVYPARAGEVLRSYVLKQAYGVRMSASLPTVIIERLFDGLTMLLFVFVALPFVHFESAALANYGPLIVWLTLAFVAALVAFLFLAARPEAARALYATAVTRFAPPRLHATALGAAERFMLGFESLARGREVFMIFGTSVLVWLFETCKYWFVMHAFHFEVSFLTLMLMNGIVNLATTIPGLPGHWGTFDLPGIAILVAAGVDNAVATPYTLVLHVALWLPITALGAFFLWRTHIDVRQARQSMAAEGDGPEPSGTGGPRRQEAAS